VASFSGSISLTTGSGDTVDRSCVIDLSIGASSSGLRVGARWRWIKQQWRECIYKFVCLPRCNIRSSWLLDVLFGGEVKLTSAWAEALAPL
jgi:hypothetical protein